MSAPDVRHHADSAHHAITELLALTIHHPGKAAVVAEMRGWLAYLADDVIELVNHGAHRDFDPEQLAASIRERTKGLLAAVEAMEAAR